MLSIQASRPVRYVARRRSRAACVAACWLFAAPSVLAGTLTPNAPPEPARIAPPTAETSLAAAIGAPQRSARFVARDRARHPREVLDFFKVGPTANVIEIWPGGGYWTEILAPYLRDGGGYVAALAAPVGTAAQIAEATQDAAALRARLAADPVRYGGVRFAELGDGRADIVPAGSADVVLTFRNLHNWMERGEAESVLAAFFRALKPGGILGIEEHRGRADRPQDPRAASGYVRQDYAVELARRAGFVLEASSEINANPKDTADWPRGVWTLPPRLILGDQDRAKYLAIGEADNFVLRFRKPSIE